MMQNISATGRATALRLRHFERPRWLITPITVTLVGGAVLVPLATSREHLLGAVLAYLNLVVVGAATVHFVQRRTLQALIPVLFLLWFAAGWLLPTLFFAALMPDAVYYPLGDSRNMLYGAARVQTVALTFLVTYLTTVLLCEGRYPPWAFSAANRRADGRVGAAVLWIATAAITLHAVSQIVPLPGPVVYVAAGSYNYLHGLMLMVGGLFLARPNAIGGRFFPAPADADPAAGPPVPGARRGVLPDRQRARFGGAAGNAVRGWPDLSE